MPTVYYPTINYLVIVCYIYRLMIKLLYSITVPSGTTAMEMCLKEVRWFTS